MPPNVTHPAVSVIVVCRNPGRRLHEALESVWAQADAAVELIVVDGASTDGTRKWLEANQGRIATLVSEPDTGIYDAMNKGIAAARGDWILFLGADDRLAGNRVLPEALTWLRQTDAGVVAGEAVYEDGRRFRIRPHINPMVCNFVHHQSAFYRRGLFAENGRFDVSLSIMADYDFNVRLWKKRVRFQSIPVQVAVCGAYGRSDSGCWQVYAEQIRVRHRHYPRWRCWVWDLGSAARFVRKRLQRSFSPPRRTETSRS